jgi:uncharacterized metal-binding protein
MTNPLPKKVLIVPCSGIGKSFGSVVREAAYRITEDLRPSETEISPLSLLVMGDEASRQAVLGCPVISLDGCKLACATKMVLESGAKVEKAFDAMEVYRRYREFKPQGIAELNEGGLMLAQALSDEVILVVDQLLTSKGEKNA